MLRKAHDSRTAAFFLLTVLFFVLLMTNTSAAAEGMRQGLSLCTDTLLPTLFPFLVLSELLISCRAGEAIGKLLQRPARLLFGISGAGTAALLAGLLCGFPVGTAAATSMYDRGEISQDELRRLFLFVNNPSPGFLMGAVGGGLFGNTRAGVALWLIVWSASFALGVLLRIVGGPVCKNEDIPVNGVQNPPSVSDLTTAVTKGLFTLFRVFAFVLFFSCFTACIAPTLHALPLPEAARALLLGLPEMTAGIACAVKTLPVSTAYLLTAFLAGFGGLSVCLQLFSVGEGRGLRILPYLIVKAIQGCLSLLLIALWMQYRPPLLCVGASVLTFAQNPIQRYSLFAMIGVAFFCLLLLTARQKRNKWGRS